MSDLKIECYPSKPRGACDIRKEGTVQTQYKERYTQWQIVHSWASKFKKTLEGASANKTCRINALQDHNQHSTPCTASCSNICCTWQLLG